jgi:hypothetical protein
MINLASRWYTFQLKYWYTFQLKSTLKMGSKNRRDFWLSPLIFFKLVYFTNFPIFNFLLSIYNITSLIL